MSHAPETMKPLHTEANTLPDPSVGSGALLGPTEYQPELWTVKKDTIYAAIHAVQNGLDYARECLTTHDTNLGRTTLKNKSWAERMEEDIRHMERTLAALRACPNGEMTDANRTEK